MFLNQITPTEIFQSFWEFILARHSIYLKRLRGEPQPWTDNPILRQFKFTNAFRACDRVSQYLIKEVIYNPAFPQERDEWVFRILLFKLFNSIPAWEVLVKEFQVPSWKEFDREAYGRVLGDAWDKGKGVDIWNAAYVQNQKYRIDLPMKHERYLALVKEMMDDGLPIRIADASTYEGAFRVLQGYPLHTKNFLPMQHLTDINYSPVINFDENDWIVPGPGCLRGIQKCFGLSPSTEQAQEIIGNLVDIQTDAFDRIELGQVTLFGRKLHAIDIQNCFCEFDKYARVAHPDFNLKNEKGKEQNRIKQKFEESGPLPTPFFPPKWGIRAIL